jgi:predicted nucleic acid-binding Zn ribbon protein
MRERKTKEEFVHIGSIIGDVLKQYGRKAANAQPAAFKGDLLLVHVTNSTWIHQLQFLKHDIISKLNAALGKPMITEIKFKIGPFS